MANVLILEASQSIDKVNACRYTLLKYLEVYNLKPPAAIAVFVYTDQPAFFESFIPFFHQLVIKEVSQTQLKAWAGGQQDPARIKMEIISEVLNHVNGSLLYLDHNTYIKAPLEGIFAEVEAGCCLLHSYRGSLHGTTDIGLEKLSRFLSTGSVVQNGGRLSTEGLRIWDTSAIGLNSSSKEVIQDVLELRDVIYRQFPRSVVESFAFSYCFQKAAEIKTCEAQIDHYGNLKEFHRLLQLFFRKNEEESIPNLIKLLYRVDAAKIRKHKELYEALPFYKKWLQIITGKNPIIRQYEKKI